MVLRSRFYFEMYRVCLYDLIKKDFLNEKKPGQMTPDMYLEPCQT